MEAIFINNLIVFHLLLSVAAHLARTLPALKRKHSLLQPPQSSGDLLSRRTIPMFIYSCYVRTYSKHHWEQLPRDTL